MDSIESPDGFSRQAVKRFTAILASGDDEEASKAKYELLLDSASLFGIVINYLVLEKNGIEFDFGQSVIEAGTTLYRIRRYEEGVDFSNPSQWQAPPHRPQGRCNHEGQEALYLGSTPTVCLLETHTMPGDIYVIGEYRCTKDVVVGGFLSDDLSNNAHYLAGNILNSFLIAPSRSRWNQELFAYLDKHYGKITPDDMRSFDLVWESGGLELPLKFGVLNQRGDFHCLTNMLCDCLARKTPQGIRYSSCYLPMEAPGISCSDYNLALYEPGIANVEFVGYEIKRNASSITPVKAIDCLLSSLNREDSGASNA